jgi:DNA modification methylase
MRILQGDNLTLLKDFPDNYFDAVVTDPPYGLGKEPDPIEVMKDWVETGFHQVKGKGFMGKEWDAFVPQPLFWKEVYRVLKHGGHVLSFFGTRTYDWGVMAMRFAGFEVRDCIQWLYGSGFPKSHNVSKAIDKMHGAEREVNKIHIQSKQQSKKGNSLQGSKDASLGWQYEITNPSTEDAKEWDGWGTALKPANEPIVLARKPLENGLSIAENVLKWGTGGINIDGCRVRLPKDDPQVKLREGKTIHAKGVNEVYSNGVGKIEGDYFNAQGRFPANLILTHHPECECNGLKKVKPSNGSGKASEKGGGFSKGMFGDGTSDNIGGGFIDENGEETIEDWVCHEDCPIRIMDEQSGESKSKRSERGNIVDNNIFGKYGEQENTLRGHSDTGGASRFFLNTSYSNSEKNEFNRFFYCAKASKSERNKGLDGFEEKRVQRDDGQPYGMNTNKTRLDGSERKEVAPKQNFHPTVKPVKLMQYLVRLITPPNGIVLDPFMGSGTTGIAAKLEGTQFVGMEQDPEYHKIAEGRIKNYVASDDDYGFDDEKPIAENIEQKDEDSRFKQTTIFDT